MSTLAGQRIAMVNAVVAHKRITVSAKLLHLKYLVLLGRIRYFVPHARTPKEYPETHTAAFRIMSWNSAYVGRPPSWQYKVLHTRLMAYTDDPWLLPR